MKNALLENSDEMNYSYFEGKDADILKIQEIASTLPFFSDYRVIVIEDCQQPCRLPSRNARFYSDCFCRKGNRQKE